MIRRLPRSSRTDTLLPYTTPLPIYARALSGANEGIWEWGDEVDGVYASQRLREIVGLQSQQASIPTDLWLARIHPDDVDEMRERMREIGRASCRERVCQYV